MRASLKALLTVWLGLGITGCSSAPQVESVDVSGVVTHDGKVVPGLTIFLQPDTGPISSGVTDAQGRFRLAISESLTGAVPGKHRVFVAFRATSPEDEMARMQGKTPEAEKPFQAMLKKYGNRSSSPLTVDVTSGMEELQLALD